MNGFITLSDTSKKNLEITDEKKSQETFIHSSSPPQILSDSTSSLSDLHYNRLHIWHWIFIGKYKSCYKMASWEIYNILASLSRRNKTKNISNYDYTHSSTPLPLAVEFIKTKIQDTFYPVALFTALCVW